MSFQYRINHPLRTEDIIAVFKSSGIRPPVNEPERIRRMFDGAR